jgi:hypothetical protein
MIIDVGELRDKHGDKVKKLSEFLEEKLKIKIDVADREITLKPEEKGKQLPSKDYLRVLLRKFLHREELREEFRVIAGKENVLVIKERKGVSET